MPVHRKAGSATGRKRSREEQDFDSEEEVASWHGAGNRPHKEPEKQPKTSKRALLSTGQQRIHQCTTCGKTCASPSALTVHLRVHSGDKPYSCDACGKACATSSDLTRHLRVHSGDKPYSCDACGKAFADSSALTRHVGVHSGDKPYSCDACDKAFSRSRNLTRHLRVHTSSP